MRTLRITVFIALGLAFGYVFSDAADAPKNDKEKASCCAKAEKDGKKCEHKCCAKSAEGGKNCEHCGGKH